MSGGRIAFRIAISAAATSAPLQPLTVTPGTIAAANSSAAAEISHATSEPHRPDARALGLAGHVETLSCTPASSSRPPTGRIRTSTSGASSAAKRANDSAGSRSTSSSLERPIRRYVPQWIGTATRGRSSVSACAARSRIEVPAGHARPPAGNGEQRDVEVARDVAHPVEQVGVAGEPDPQRAAHEVAEGGHAHPEDLPAPVLGVGRGDVDAVHVGVVADVELRHVREPAAAEHVAGADRDDDARRATDEPQRLDVEVVVVEMRDEQRVDVVERADVRVPDTRRRCSILPRRTGSVSSRTPSSSSRTVLWPTHVIAGACTPTL